MRPALRSRQGRTIVSPYRHGVFIASSIQFCRSQAGTTGGWRLSIRIASLLFFHLKSCAQPVWEPKSTLFRCLVQKSSHFTIRPLRLAGAGWIFRRNTCSKYSTGSPGPNHIPLGYRFHRIDNIRRYEAFQPADSERRVLRSMGNCLAYLG